MNPRKLSTFIQVSDECFAIQNEQGVPGPEIITEWPMPTLDECRRAIENCESSFGAGEFDPAEAAATAILLAWQDRGTYPPGTSNEWLLSASCCYANIPEGVNCD
jgi:hypothetical protein